MIVGIYIIVPVILLGFVFGGCPNGFEHHNNSCYRVMIIPSSWIEAQLYCHVFGGQLAMVDSAQEEAIIEGIFQRYNDSVSGGAFWLAGSDAAGENDWKWYTFDGVSSAMTYTNWDLGEPNNVKHTHDYEDCLEIFGPMVSRPHQFKWNDGNCEDKRSFICEASYESNPNEITIG